MINRKLFSVCLIIVFTNISKPVYSIDLHKRDFEEMPIATVGHYGAGIDIAEIYVNDAWIGNQSGWGGGGGEICCAPVSTRRSKPVIIQVKWQTCEANYEERVPCKLEWHNASVPINFSEKIPGHHFGLVIHFLPGHQVEAWTSDKGILESNYPGPKYPTGPAPRYVPLKH